jgi:uncharacterized protein (UPF0332 family)
MDQAVLSAVAKDRCKSSFRIEHCLHRRTGGCLAAYHAAEALLHERTGSGAKTHRGLRSEFARLARTEPRIDPGFLRFLANAYEVKSVADYDTEPENVSAATAQAAIEGAARMIEAMAEVLGAPESSVG